jgi:hypothetical protein
MFAWERYQGALTIGSTRLWLPSRKSVDSQRGGLSIVLLGHVLSGRFNGWNFLYLVEGSLSIGIVGGCAPTLLFAGQFRSVAMRGDYMEKLEPEA